MKRLSLIQLKENRKARVAEICAGSALHNRLMSMGIYKDRELTKLSHIGLKGPVVIKVGRTILALGHGMAGKIIVET